MAVKLERFRKTKKKVVGNNVNNKKINNSGKKGFKIEEIEDNVSDDESKSCLRFEQVTLW